MRYLRSVLWFLFSGFCFLFSGFCSVVVPFSLRCGFVIEGLVVEKRFCKVLIMLKVLYKLKIIFHRNDWYVRKKVYFCAAKKEIMTLRTYLEKDKQLPADIVDILDDLFEEVEVSKGETLIVEGSQSHKVFFVEEGITRLYYQKEGKDVTYTFIGEGQFYAPIENIFLKM